MLVLKMECASTTKFDRKGKNIAKGFDWYQKDSAKTQFYGGQVYAMNSKRRGFYSIFLYQFSRNNINTNFNNIFYIFIIIIFVI